MSEVPDHEKEEEFLAEMRAVAECLSKGDFAGASEHNSRMEELAYCDICERLAKGTRAGVSFVTAYTPENANQRADFVANEITQLLDDESPEEAFGGEEVAP